MGVPLSSGLAWRVASDGHPYTLSGNNPLRKICTE